MKKKLLVFSLGMFILQMSMVAGYHSGGLQSGKPPSSLTVVFVVIGLLFGMAALIWYARKQL